MKQTGNRKRRYLRSRITRKLIIDTAEKVFMEKGYNKTTITQISKQANVGYGTVYSHFQGKDDLLNNVIDRAMESFFNILNDINEITNVEDLYLIFENKIFATFRIAADNRSVFKVLQQALGQSETVFNHWDNTINGFINRINNDLITAREKGIVNKNLDLYLSAKSVILTLESFLWEIVHDKESDLQHLTETLTNLFIQGLCSHEIAALVKK